MGGTRSSQVSPSDEINKSEPTGKGSWVKSDVKLSGKTVLITGANTGIGLETAVDLARREANVVIACRNSKKGQAAVQEIIARSGSERISCRELDLSSLNSVRKFCDGFLRDEVRLDVLINNAGVMMCPESRTEDGFETHLGVNHLGHFLLTTLLLDLLKASAPSRVVTLSSVMHTPRYNAYIHWNDLDLEKSYNPRDAYSQSKLMNVLFSRELAKRLEGTGVTTYCVHPGLVRTELLRNVGARCSLWDTMFCCVTKLTKMCWKTPEHGAQTSIYCAIAPELENETGNYYSDCKKTKEARAGRNDEDAARLWEVSEDLVKK